MPVLEGRSEEMGIPHDWNWDRRECRRCGRPLSNNAGVNFQERCPGPEGAHIFANGACTRCGFLQGRVVWEPCRPSAFAKEVPIKTVLWEEDGGKEITVIPPRPEKRMIRTTAQGKLDPNGEYLSFVDDPVPSVGPPFHVFDDATKKCKRCGVSELRVLAQINKTLKECQQERCPFQEMEAQKKESERLSKEYEERKKREAELREREKKVHKIYSGNRCGKCGLPKEAFALVPECPNTLVDWMTELPNYVGKRNADKQKIQPASGDRSIILEE